MGASAKAGTARLGLLALIGAALALALFAAPASAKKTHLLIETFGSAAQPEFRGSTALAVDRSNGDLLVVDESPANTISRFKPYGEPDPFSALGTNTIDAKKGPGAKACGEEPSSCDLNPEHPGFIFRGFQSETQIAVDNSGTVTDGDIYVTQLEKAQGNLVDIFASTGEYLGQLTEAGGVGFGFTEIEGEVLRFGPCGVAVDEEGNVFVSGYVDEHIYRFDPTANPPTNADGALLATPPGSGPVCSLAAGAGPSAGALFVSTAIFTTGASNSLFKLNAVSGSLEGTFDPGKNKVIAVDPLSGHVFETGGESRELTASGTPVSTFTTTGRGIAIDGSAERVYVSAAQGNGGNLNSDVRVLGPVVTVPDVLSGSYEVTGDTSVRVKGTVNPDGQALSECSFEYGLTEPHKQGELYEHSEPCEAPNAAEVGSGAGPVEVHADLTELGKETLYHYRLVAKNANAALYPTDPDGVGKGADQTFKTPSVPGIKALWASDVLFTEATLKATLNPENSPTTYRFEYGDQGPCDANPCIRAPALPAPEPSLGSDGADHAVQIHLGELEPSTTYHYRLIATNGIGVSESADLHFTTFAVTAPSSGECPNDAFRSGFGALLPDCRAYEMVSPVDKGGGDIRDLGAHANEPGVLEQSSLAGDRLAYGSSRAFGDAASSPWTSQYIAQRVEGAGWQTHAIDPPRGERVTGGLIAETDTEFRFFSPDLCEAWLPNYGELAQPQLPAQYVAGYPNLLRREDRLCGPEEYAPLAPLSTPQGLLPGTEFSPELQGVSADLEHAIVTAAGGLATGGKGNFEQLYESYPGPGGAPALALVCVLPDGSALNGACTAGSSYEGSLRSRETSASGALSADGGRVYWSDKNYGEGKLYVRLNPDQPESARTHGAATGKGNLIGPATGTGNVFSGAEGEIVKSVAPTSGGFAIGQEISDSAGKIPANTKIKACAPTPDCSAPTELTLTAKATGTKFGDTLTGLASATVPGIVTETGAFEAGQAISAPAIPPGTTVLSCSPSCGLAATSLTLSAKATKTKIGAELSATSPCTEAATRACTIPVSETAEKAAKTSGSFFWGASADGAKAIFTTGNPNGEAKLYSFEPDGELTTLLAEGVYGVMGMSEDAGRIYFASSEVLDAGATEGKPNLYLYEAGAGPPSTTFIATLASKDLFISSEDAAIQHQPRARSARVSPNGAHAAFTSYALLTGYDSKDAGSGEATKQLYVYDAGVGKLICASCNPSGARPEGSSAIPGFETEMHAAGDLSEDGSRLFFESADALTPRDSNGAVDVYQWEAPETGGCAQGNPDYSASDGGCIDLISTGQNHLDSRFVEATPDGQDVFIATLSGLLPQDPGLIDIYDARANGGLPTPQGPDPGCEGEACQSAPEAPNDPTPASSSFEGAGNVVEEAPVTRTPCGKRKVRKHGKCVARHPKRAKRHQTRKANRNQGAGR